MRNLTKAITAVSLLAPMSAFPLGIGDIRLQSALNEKLEAEIALHSSAGEKISNLHVKLAPPEKFDEAGVPWNYFLSKIKFETVKTANGATVIKLSSSEVLREPFLDFLVEVSWDKGNLYREFTVLVDPPVAYAQAVIPVVEKPTQAAVVKKAKPVIKPVAEQPRQIIEKKPVKAKTTIKAIKPIVKTVKAEAPKRAKVTQNTRSTISNGKYGPTHRNDSLWKVADRTNNYGGVTRAQMMMAIYEANPNAFYKQNVNALKYGAVLDIPEKEVVLKLSRKEAQLAFKQQADQWSGVVTAESKKKTQITQQQAEKNNGKLKLEAPTEAEIAEMAVVSSTNDQGGKATSDGVVSSIDGKSLGLQDKVGRLEGEMSKMQELLTLKDKQLADLQLQMKSKGGAIGASIDTKTIEKNEQKKGGTLTSKVEPTENVEPSKTGEKENVEPIKIEPKEKLNVVKVEPKSEEKTVKVEPELVDENDSDNGVSTALLGTLGLPLLGLLGWSLWRRREKDDVESDSMFDSAAEIIPSSTLGEKEAITSKGNETSLPDELDESSFLSEFASSDFHTFDKELSEDVDPVLEADVYLAYGRYQQAEELMRQAIADQPERDEAKLKLLEIFHANKNKEAFDVYVEELEKTGKNKDQKFWSKVVEMGDELDEKSSETQAKNSHLGGKASFAVDDKNIAQSFFDDNEKQESVELETSDLDEVKNNNEMDFDLSIFDEDDDKTADTLGKIDDSGIDFDLSQFSSDKPEVNEGLSPEKPKENDFDLNSIGIDTSSFQDGNKGDESIESFDFDFDTSPEKNAEAGASDLADMDEIETKVDLAKAYIDMGDYDAAKTIAKEALEKGSSEQKKAAQDILDLLD